MYLSPVTFEIVIIAWLPVSVYVLLLKAYPFFSSAKHKRGILSELPWYISLCLSALLWEIVISKEVTCRQAILAKQSLLPTFRNCQHCKGEATQRRYSFRDRWLLCYEWRNHAIRILLWIQRSCWCNLYKRGRQFMWICSVQWKAILEWRTLLFPTVQN